MKHFFLILTFLLMPIDVLAAENYALPKKFLGRWESLSSKDIPYGYLFKEDGRFQFVAKEPYYTTNKDFAYEMYKFIRVEDHVAYILVRNTHNTKTTVLGLEIFDKDEGNDFYDVMRIYDLEGCIKISDSDWNPFKREKLYNLITYMLIENPKCMLERQEGSYTRQSP